ncbi:hypothetical protein OL229_14070 [Neisseriaceae bacterium JH1-16]|nr:hypothetical protein [Neisseriaceae bacterium JH1-16]
MNEVCDSLSIARASLSLPDAQPLCALALVTDVEHATPGSPLPPPAEALELAPLRLSEALLPDIRLLAMLSVTLRANLETRPSPARLSDAADWLAARIAVLGLSHVLVSPAQLPTLDEANRRLAVLAERFGLSVSPAAPVLLPAALPVETGVLRAWCAAEPAASGRAAGLVDASRQAHRAARRRLSGLFATLGLAAD